MGIIRFRLRGFGASGFRVRVEGLDFFFFVGPFPPEGLG